MILISQPHSFLSCLSLSQKIEASFFDVSVRTCTSGYVIKGQFYGIELFGASIWISEISEN